MGVKDNIDIGLITYWLRCIFKVAIEECALELQLVMYNSLYSTVIVYCCHNEKCIN
jgi:hypothetical protein